MSVNAHPQTTLRPTLKQSLLVTAPQRQPSHLDGRRPWGTVHVRRDGSTQTVCGLPTVGWFVFWQQPFDAHGPQACAACGRALAGRGETRNAPSDRTTRP